MPAECWYSPRMPKETRKKQTDRDGNGFPAAGPTDADVMEAMKSLSSYIDITPADFRELYRVAFRLAVERFTRSVTAGDIMSETVVTVNPENTVDEVVRIMSEGGVSGVPVVDPDGRVVGILSEKDVIRRLLGGRTGSIMTLATECLRSKRCMCAKVSEIKAGEVMTAPVVTVRAEATLAELARLISEKQVNRLPVTDADGRLLGILARNDIVDAMMRIGSWS